MPQYASVTRFLPWNIRHKMRELSNIQRRVDALCSPYQLAYAAGERPASRFSRELYTGLRRALVQRAARRQVKRHMSKTGW